MKLATIRGAVVTNVTIRQSGHTDYFAISLRLLNGKHVILTAREDGLYDRAGNYVEGSDVKRGKPL